MSEIADAAFQYQISLDPSPQRDGADGLLLPPRRGSPGRRVARPRGPGRLGFELGQLADPLVDVEQARGAQLINTYEQSARVRNLFQWVDCFKGMTAPVFTEADVRELPEGRYFVKGECSSLKNRGPQFAFANSLAEVETLVEYLSNDSWMSRERLVIRPRRDYKRLGTSDGGLPIFHERRVFTYNGNVLLDGFYWESSRQNITEDIPVLTDDYYTTRDTAVKIANTVAPFVVVDLAQFEDGTWEVIELNDGCQSGLPQDSDNTFYKALADAQND